MKKSGDVNHRTTKLFVYGSFTRSLSCREDIPLISKFMLRAEVKMFKFISRVEVTIIQFIFRVNVKIFKFIFRVEVTIFKFIHRALKPFNLKL